MSLKVLKPHRILHFLTSARPEFELFSSVFHSDEEGEEEIRRRERELGIVPTSPASLLSHLQLAGPSPPPSTTPAGSPTDLQQPRVSQYASGMFSN